MTSRDKLKIAIVRQSYRKDGGAERFVSRLITGFGGADVEVSLIARRWQGAPEPSANIRIVQRQPLSLGRIMRELSFARSVHAEIQAKDYNLVQSNERITGCDVFRAGDGVHREWLAQKSRVQTTLAKWFTLIRPYHLYSKWAERKVFEDSHLRAVICNSKMVRDEIIRYFDVDPRKLYVVYNGVDTRHFHPSVAGSRTQMRRKLQISEDSTVLLLVGSGFQRKGVSVAIQSLATVPKTELVIVGKGKGTTRYRQLATRLGCGQRVHFAGTTDDVRPYYGMANGLILPTLYDPFANVVLEAMACGLPVITSTSCGAIDIIENGRNGFTCDAIDVDGFSNAIRRLTNHETAAAIGRCARSTVEPLTIDRAQAETLNLYHALLGRIEAGRAAA